MGDMRRVSRALKDVTGAVKTNLDIHGNTLPHLHAHFFPATWVTPTRTARLTSAVRRTPGSSRTIRRSSGGSWRTCGPPSKLPNGQPVFTKRPTEPNPVTPGCREAGRNPDGATLTAPGRTGRWSARPHPANRVGLPAGLHHRHRPYPRLGALATLPQPDADTRLSEGNPRPADCHERPRIQQGPQKRPRRASSRSRSSSPTRPPPGGAAG
jgi:hypothetical protein